MDGKNVFMQMNECQYALKENLFSLSPAPQAHAATTMQFSRQGYNKFPSIAIHSLLVMQ